MNENDRVAEINFAEGAITLLKVAESLRLELGKEKPEVEQKLQSLSDLVFGLKQDVKGLKENISPRKLLNVKQEVDKKSDGRKDKEGPAVVISGPPIQYHSMTRKDCTWALVQRRSSSRIILDISGLRTTINSEQYTSQDAQKVELTNILTAGLSQEINHEVSGGGFTSTVSGSISAEQIEQWVDSYLASHTFRLIHYIVTIHGTIVARQDWTIRELWDWVGADCERPDPQEYVFEMPGPSENIEVSTTFDIWEMYAPALGPSGEGWAGEEAKRQHQELLRQGAWLPELPLPSGFPPPNVG